MRAIMRASLIRQLAIMQASLIRQPLIEPQILHKDVLYAIRQEACSDSARNANNDFPGLMAESRMYLAPIHWHVQPGKQLFPGLYVFHGHLEITAQGLL